jgi:hypothetical protein
MTTLHIEKNDKLYEKLLKSPESDKLGGHADDKKIKTFEPGAHIVTGNKTKEFGGGPSPDGFILAKNGKLLARVKLNGNPAVKGNTYTLK